MSEGVKVIGGKVKLGTRTTQAIRNGKYTKSLLKLLDDENFDIEQLILPTKYIHNPVTSRLNLRSSVFRKNGDLRERSKRMGVMKSGNGIRRGKPKLVTASAVAKSRFSDTIREVPFTFNFLTLNRGGVDPLDVILEATKIAKELGYFIPGAEHHWVTVAGASSDLVTSVDLPVPKEFRELPLLREDVLDLSLEGLDLNQSVDNCGKNMVLKELVNLTRGIKKKIIVQERLEHLTDKIFTIGDIIENYCDVIGAGLMVVNRIGKVIDYKPKNFDKNIPHLMFLVADDHCYPITDAKYRKAISSSLCQESLNTRIKSTMGIQSKEYPVPEYSDVFMDKPIDDINWENGTALYIYTEKINGSNPVELSVIEAFENFGKEMKVKKTRNGYKLAYKKGLPKFIYCPDFDLIKKMAGMTNKLKVITDVEPKDDLVVNHSVNFYIEKLDVLKDWSNVKGYEPESYPKYHRQVRQECYEEIEKFVGLDIKKCFSTSLYAFDAKFGFGVYLLQDKFHKWTGGKIVTGEYYIDTKETRKLFQGKGIYCDDVIQMAIDESIKFEILRYRTPSIILPKEYFRELIDKVFSSYNERDAKNIINRFIGCLDIIDKVSFKTFFSRSKQEVAYYLHKNEGCYYREIADGYFEINIPKKQNRLDHRQAIHRKVLDLYLIQIYKLAKEYNFSHTAVNADRLIFKEGTKLKYTTYHHIFGTRPDCKPYCKDHRLIEYPHWDEFEKSLDIDIKEIDIDNSKGREYWKEMTADNHLVLERPGQGKSNYSTNLDRENTLVLAPTHTGVAASNGNGTLHSTFHYNFEDDTLSLGKMERTLSGIDKIVIDEAGLVPMHIWEVCYLVKINHPKIKWTLLGDCGQNQPIERTSKYTVKKIMNADRLYIMSLFCDTRYRLMHNHRSNNEWLDEVEYYIKNIEEGFDRYPVTRYTERSVCYTHSVRKEQNSIAMEHYLERTGNESVEIDTSSVKNKLLLEKIVQDVKLAVGMPVRCFNTSKKINVKNGQLFEVTKIGESVEMALLDSSLNKTEKLILVTKEQWMQNFYLYFCSNTFIVQGQTWNMPFTVFQVERIACLGEDTGSLRNVMGRTSIMDIQWDKN